MAIYVVSDLHGCKDEFDLLLEKISFNDYDEMYIIGDVCDRGAMPIPLLQEIMAHKNMHLLLGNHDLWLKKYIPDMIEEKRSPGSLTVNHDLFTWLHYNGGLQTLDQFLELDFPICYDIQEYMEKLPIYERISLQGTNYLLVHAGLGEYAKKGVNIATVPEEVLVWAHIGIDENPFEKETMIVGHLPTFHYGQEYDGKMILREKSRLFHIDCGCVYGRALGCLRLNDLEEFYIPSSYPYLQFR